MPWYWSDDIARLMVDLHKLDDTSARPLIAAPVAFRSQEETIEEAIDSLADDGEIPLLAA